MSRIVEGTEHSSQKAELSACLIALQTVQGLVSHNANVAPEGIHPNLLKKVVLKMDSAYVVKGITDQMPKWKQNGYKTAKGQQVTNTKLFKAIDAQVERLERMEVQCLFWHVPRSQNSQADLLANAALNEKEITIDNLPRGVKRGYAEVCD